LPSNGNLRYTSYTGLDLTVARPKARGGQTFSTEGHIEDFIHIQGPHAHITHITSIIALKT